MKQPYLAKLLFLLLFVCAGFTGAFAQTGSVSGRVVDEKNGGLPGVTVLIEGTPLGNSTNSDGTYSIQNIPAGPRTLVISFVGYTTNRIPVTITAGQNTAVATSTLNENTTLLNEAVVVGYGTQRKQDVTGSVAAVTSREFVKGQVTSPEQLINGKVAGVQISSSGGAPGAASVIRIRGGSSLNASNDPLIVIDGVPVDNSELRGSSNALALINPNDIETFTVLKDASATAIYGSRASNGVIIITTKKGLAGEKMTVNVSSLFSMATTPRRVEVLSGDEYRALVNRIGTEEQKQLLGTANTDWQDVILRNAFTQDYTASVSGSAGKLPFRVSVGHLNQDGVIKTNNLKRNTVSIGLTPALLNGDLRIDANVKGSWIDNRFVEEGVIGNAVSFDPTQPVTLNTSPFGGFFEYYNTDPVTGQFTNLVGLAPTNPLARLQQRRDRSTVKRAISNIQFDYKLPFLRDLRANLNLGYDLSRSNGNTFVPAAIAASEFNRGGTANFYSQERDNKLLEFYLNYSKDLGNAGRLELLGGYSYQDFLRESPPVPDLRADGTPASPNIVLPVKTQYTLLSFYGRANYNFKDRYLFTFTLRNDNSSRFGKDYRAGYFPAGAVAWRVKGENFLANSTFLSELKLRAGYGITGQQDVGSDYPSLLFYEPGENTVQYPIGGVYVNTLRPVSFDPAIKWEETTTYNVGLDYGFFDGRVTGTVDLYQRETNDLLNETDASAGTNFRNRFFTNLGSLENRGLELGLNGIIAEGNDFNWSLNANAAFNRNKITEIPGTGGLLVSGIEGGTGNRISLNSVGFPVNTYYVVQQKYENGRPIVPTNANGGLNAFVDQNGDGQITELDRVRYRSPNPKAILGLGSNATYKRVSIAFTMRAYLGNYVYNNINSLRANTAYFLPGNPFLRNTTPNFADTQFTGLVTNAFLSDYFIEDGSFARMDNITLGYDLGETSNIRVSAAVQNAFIISDFKSADPEKLDGGSPGVINNVYPRPRTFTLGVSATF